MMGRTHFTFDQRMILWQILRKAQGADITINWNGPEVQEVCDKIMPRSQSTVMGDSTGLGKRGLIVGGTTNNSARL